MRTSGMKSAKREFLLFFLLLSTVTVGLAQYFCHSFSKEKVSDMFKQASLCMIHIVFTSQKSTTLCMLENYLFLLEDGRTNINCRIYLNLQNLLLQELMQC